MIEYFDWIALIPILFIIPPLPYVRKLFVGVDVTKFSYGASTTGILLTFFGIWQGLLGFDVQNMDSSLPTLVEGLKVAFGSSLTGLTTSLLINLLFVKSKDDVESSLEKTVEALHDLKASLEAFTARSSQMQTEALLSAVKKLIDELEMGINSETKETMLKFRNSVEYLSEWQKKYMDEIKSVTEAMDQNAVVTQVTTDQLNRTNEVLAELAPVTEKIAASIGWVQKALPTTRKRGIDLDEK